MCRFFDRFTEVDMVFTVRPQSEILVSLFKQITKDASIYFDGTIWTLFLENAPWLDFSREIAKWKKASLRYRPTINVVTYSPKSLLADVTTTIGIGSPLPFDARPNASPSDLATAVLIETMDFRWSLGGLDRKEQFVKLVSENAAGVDFEDFPLSQPELALIDAIYAASNRAVAEEYCKGAPLFPGAEISAAAIDGDRAKLVRAFSNLITKNFK
jgi:hypothetical protein